MLRFDTCGTRSGLVLRAAGAAAAAGVVHLAVAYAAYLAAGLAGRGSMDPPLALDAARTAAACAAAVAAGWAALALADTSGRGVWSRALRQLASRAASRPGAVFAAASAASALSAAAALASVPCAQYQGHPACSGILWLLPAAALCALAWPLPAGRPAPDPGRSPPGIRDALVAAVLAAAVLAAPAPGSAQVPAPGGPPAGVDCADRAKYGGRQGTPTRVLGNAGLF